MPLDRPGTRPIGRLFQPVLFRRINVRDSPPMATTPELARQPGPKQKCSVGHRRDSVTICTSSGLLAIAVWNRKRNTETEAVIDVAFSRDLTSTLLGLQEFYTFQLPRVEYF